jgi:hypothetical protein
VQPKAVTAAIRASGVNGFAQYGPEYPAGGPPWPDIRMSGTVGHRSDTTAASCSPSSRGIRMSLTISPTFVPSVASSEGRLLAVMGL